MPGESLWPRWAEGVLVLLAAVAFVVAVDARTGETAPIWDGKWYFQLAQEGYDARRMAPFVFRPGMPFLARWLAAASGLDVELAFKLIGRTAATLVLCSVYAGARALSARAGLAAFVALVVGLTYHHVRFPLFYWSLVDVAGYAVFLLAFWCLWEGWTIRAGLISALGLFFKEMLLIPWIVSLVEGVARTRRRPARPAWLGLAAVAFLGVAVFVLPRLLLEVHQTQQWIDPFHSPETLSRLWEAPASFERISTIVSAYLVYWMPTWLLLTPTRVRALLPALRSHRRSLAVYLGLLFPLVLYGGVNVAVFVSYCVAAQVLVLVRLGQTSRLAHWELLGTLVCLFFFQHFHRTIPDPHVDEQAYLTFYGFGDPALNARRLMQAGAWLAAMGTARFLAGRIRVRAA